MGDKKIKSVNSKEFLELVRKKEAEGKIVIMTFEGAQEGSLPGILEQPTEGLLYDLNRDRLTVSHWMSDEEYGSKWVNDYAVYCVISYLHEFYLKKRPRPIKERVTKWLRDLKG